MASPAGSGGAAYDNGERAAAEAMPATLQIEHHEHLLEKFDPGCCTSSSSSPVALGELCWCSLCDSQINAECVRYLCKERRESQCLFFVLCSQCSRRPLGFLDGLSSLHPHPLRRCSAGGAAASTSTTAWRCCGVLSSPNASERKCRRPPAAPLVRFRCAICDLDLCADCLESQEAAVWTELHPHPLLPFVCEADASTWRCASTILPGGCRSAEGPPQSAVDRLKRFRCLRCGFEFCSKDVRATAVPRPMREEQREVVSVLSTPTRKPSNKTMVEMLEHTGHIKTPAVKRAFLMVDRAFFAPEDQLGSGSSPYTGAPMTGVDKWKLPSAAFVADCLEELRGTSTTSTCLVISPCSGYFNALLAVLFNEGVSCGIDLSESVLKRAKRCVSRWRASLGDSSRSSLADVEFLQGNCLLIDQKTVEFDRIHCDVECSAANARRLAGLLRVGGVMIVVIDGTVRIFERETPFGVSTRDFRMNSTGRRSNQGKIVVPDFSTKPEPVAFASTRVCRNRESEFSERLDEARRVMTMLFKAPAPELPVRSPRKIVEKTSSPSVSVTEVLARSDYDVGIADFLRSLGLEKYLTRFREEEVTMETLMLLTDDDLRSMGVVIGPRRLITSEIARRTALNKSSVLRTSAVLQPQQKYLSAVPERAIGSGSFGVVYRGLWSGTTPVAMKTLYQDPFKCEPELMSEVNLLSTLRHPNVLVVYGVASFEGSLYMVMELAEGCVLNLLQQRGKELSTPILLGMALSCATGMNYLAENRILHRDLAARNLLYYREGTTYIVKVGDFGLAKCLNTQSDYYRFASSADMESSRNGGIAPAQARVFFPIKWTAPETLAYRKHTVSSDVWSYGVTLWEIFNHGVEPYTGMPPVDVYPFLQQGGRLVPPPECPTSISQLMKLCWQADPDSRPNFAEICDVISKIMSPDARRTSSRGSFTMAPGVDYFSSSRFPAVGSLNTVREDIPVPSSLRVVSAAASPPPPKDVVTIVPDEGSTYEQSPGVSRSPKT